MFKYRPYLGLRGYWCVIEVRLYRWLAPRLPEPLRQAVLNDAWAAAQKKRNGLGLGFLSQTDGALDMLLAYKE